MHFDAKNQTPFIVNFRYFVHDAKHKKLTNIANLFWHSRTVPSKFSSLSGKGLRLQLNKRYTLQSHMHY